jgi:hypothetical protein
MKTTVEAFTHKGKTLIYITPETLSSVINHLTRVRNEVPLNDDDGNEDREMAEELADEITDKGLTLAPHWDFDLNNGPWGCANPKELDYSPSCLKCLVAGEDYTGKAINADFREFIDKFILENNIIIPDWLVLSTLIEYNNALEGEDWIVDWEEGPITGFGIFFIPRDAVDTSKPKINLYCIGKIPNPLYKKD